MVQRPRTIPKNTVTVYNLFLGCIIILLVTAGLRAADKPFVAEVVRDQLLADKALDIRELEVEVAGGGEVILRGVVTSLQARNAAEKSIRNRVGVGKVTNLLRIVNDAPDTDTAGLAGSVSDALTKIPYLSGREVLVRTAGDSVVLDGVVESAFQYEQAGKAAAAVPGVGAVVNNVIVADNIFDMMDEGQAPLTVDDPAVRALIESYYEKLGVKPELAIRMDTAAVNLAAEWADSLYTNPPKAGGPPRVVNPETRYYEAFNFVGVGIYVIRKIFGWDKKKKER